MSRNALVTLLTALAVLLQAAALNRLPLPSGLAPDLVIIVVVAAALSAGSTTGAVCGFAAGLALDILPPADTELGRSALVLCLVGFFAGRAQESARRSPLLPFAILALAVVGADLADAAVGLLLADPRFSLAAAAAALPLSVASTLVLSPFVFAAMRWVLGRAAEDEAVIIGGAPRFRGGRR